MGVRDTDPETSARLRAILDDEHDIHEFDNTRGRPVGVRETGGSYVQTIPGGATDLLDISSDAKPDIWVHPESNAITFVY